jgi:acetyl esterase/lipase
VDRSILARPGPEPDQNLRYGAGADHAVDAWLPSSAEERPLVIVVHGGFWRAEYDRTHTRPMCAALRDAGWPVAAIEYRRVAGDPDATADDIREALAWVPGQLPGTRIVVLGHSAGGHLALWLAATCPPADLAGTLALAPVADLAAAHSARLSNGAVAEFLGGPPSLRPDLDPMLLGQPAGAVTLIHGADDTTVPPALSRSYAGTHPHVRLVELPGTAHFELIDPASRAWPTVRSELDRLSGAPRRSEHSSPENSIARGARGASLAGVGDDVAEVGEPHDGAAPTAESQVGRRKQ